MADLLSNAIRAENLSLKDQIAERDEVRSRRANCYPPLLARDELPVTMEGWGMQKLEYITGKYQSLEGKFAESMRHDQINQIMRASEDERMKVLFENPCKVPCLEKRAHTHPSPCSFSTSCTPLLCNLMAGLNRPHQGYNGSK